MHDDDDGPPGARAGDQGADQIGLYRGWSTDRILSRIALLERELTKPATSQQQRASGFSEADYRRRLQAGLAELRRELVRREGAH